MPTTQCLETSSLVRPRFAFGTVTASSRQEASTEAKRVAIHALRMKPKHVGRKCTER